MGSSQLRIHFYYFYCTYNIKIILSTIIIWLPVVTCGYSWLPKEKLHLSALNNRYSKLNWKRKQKLCTTGIKTRRYVTKVTFELRRHVSFGLPTVYQVLRYHCYTTLTCLKHSVNSVVFSGQIDIDYLFYDAFELHVISSPCFINSKALKREWMHELFFVDGLPTGNLWKFAH